MGVEFLEFQFVISFFKYDIIVFNIIINYVYKIKTKLIDNPSVT